MRQHIHKWTHYAPSSPSVRAASGLRPLPYLQNPLTYVHEIWHICSIHEWDGMSELSDGVDHRCVP